MLTEYYFSFPTPDVQAAQLSNYIRRPYNQATMASGVIQNLELWKVSIQIHREVAGLMLSLSHMRKAFFHLIQPVVHDELFDFALKMAREANLDARAISEEDTLIFFKRIVANLHGVNLNKEFTNPKKKQENTVKAITSGESTPGKGGGKSKGKAPALPKGNKGKGKGMIDRKLHLHRMVREVSRKREMQRRNLPSLKERETNQCQRRTLLRDRLRHLLQLPRLYPKQGRR